MMLIASTVFLIAGLTLEFGATPGAALLAAGAWLLLIWTVLEVPR